MPRVFRLYDKLLRAHPYKTNMLSTGLLFAAGDGLAQTFFPHHEDEDFEKPAEFHPQRTLRALVYGSLFFAPLTVKWHTQLLPSIQSPLLSAASRLQMSAARIKVHENMFRLLLDALIVPGIVWIPLYNTVMSVLAMHEHPLEVAQDKLKANWWTVLRASWVVWTPLQMVNLFFVPIHLRVVTSNVWSVGWASFLSFMHNTPGHGRGSGHYFEEILDIETADEEETMVYA